MPSSQFKIRSDEITEIIGQIPSWTVQWGMTAISVVIVILIFCSFYIKFPDTINAKVSISSLNYPFEVSWYRDGPQKHILMVEEGQTVKTGDTLIVEKNLVDGSLTSLISAIEGIVAFQEGSPDNPSRSVIIVYPHIQQIKTTIFLKAKNIGMVKVGQDVLIELDAYPSEDFGLLQGRLIDLSNVPIKEFYQADIELNNRLITTEGKEIDQQYILEGNAEVILDDKTIFKRIFSIIY